MPDITNHYLYYGAVWKKIATAPVPALTDGNIPFSKCNDISANAGVNGK